MHIAFRFNTCCTQGLRVLICFIQVFILWKRVLTRILEFISYPCTRYLTVYSQSVKMPHQQKLVIFTCDINSILVSTAHYFAIFHQQLLLTLGYKRKCHNTALAQLPLNVYDTFRCPEVHDFPVTRNAATEPTLLTLEVRRPQVPSSLKHLV